MALGITTNLAALDAQRQQARSQSDLGTAIARLSSGLRINSAKDDAAGLAIADRITSQVRGTTQAGRNANDGISLAQTAEGALASIDANLQRIRELAVQSANATNSASDRASLQLEVAQLQSEIDRVARQTQFNGVNLLDGSFANQAFQVGANAGQTIGIGQLASARTADLGTYRGFAQNLALGLPSGPTVTDFFAPYPLSVTIGAGVPIQLGSVTRESRSIAAAINAGGIAGLTATASPSGCDAAISTANASASGTATLFINGVAISLSGQAGVQNLAGNRLAAIQAINAQSAVTGVVASDTGSGVLTVAVDGRLLYYDYSPGSFTGSSYDDFGLTNSQFIGGVNVSYAAPAGSTGSVSFTQPVGGFNNTTAIGSAGSAVRDLDISTLAGANAALVSVDLALASIGNERASLGAAQNRFASTIGNLQTAGDNLAASRSRIQDADFALETASLSRAQVLQQAGTAMIAQANQGTGQVLALLRSG